MQVMCNRCRIPKPGGWSASPVANKPAREMRPGDWICPSCANHNFADKLFCNRCNLSKEKAGEVPGSGPDQQPPTQAWRFRQGDWMCPVCGNHNYSSRTACNRCNAPRPSDSEKATALHIVARFNTFCWCEATLRTTIKLAVQCTTPLEVARVELELE